MGKCYGIVYKVTNKINGKVYIGQTVQSLNRRITTHISHALCERDNFYFHKAIVKYGKENFGWEIIAKCYSREELNKTEIRMIEKYGAVKKGYNFNIGGNSNAGFSRTERDKQETSERMRGKRNPMYGKHPSRKTRRKMSESHSGKKHYSYGKYGKDNLKARKYIITTPSGKEIFVHGIANFCRSYREEKLSYGTLIQIAKGKRKHHKGYKCRYYIEVQKNTNGLKKV